MPSHSQLFVSPNHQHNYSVFSVFFIACVFLILIFFSLFSNPKHTYSLKFVMAIFGVSLRWTLNIPLNWIWIWHWVLPCHFHPLFISHSFYPSPSFPNSSLSANPFPSFFAAFSLPSWDTSSCQFYHENVNWNFQLKLNFLTIVSDCRHYWQS